MKLALECAAAFFAYVGFAICAGKLLAHRDKGYNGDMQQPLSPPSGKAERHEPEGGDHHAS